MMLTYTCVLVVGLAVRCYCEDEMTGTAATGDPARLCTPSCVHGECQESGFCKCGDRWCDKRLCARYCRYGYCDDDYGFCHCYDDFKGEWCGMQYIGAPLSDDAIIGITIGLMFAIGAGIFVFIMIRRRNKRRDAMNAENARNARNTAPANYGQPPATTVTIHGQPSATAPTNYGQPPATAPTNYGQLPATAPNYSVQPPARTQSTAV